MATTLPAFISGKLAAPREIALAEWRGDVASTLGSRDVHRRAAAVAYALRARGVNRGDRVAIAAANSIDWLIADFAILYAGGVVVPMFPSIALDQFAYILADSEAKLVFLDDDAAVDRIRAGCATCPPAVAFAGSGPGSFAALVEEGEALLDADPGRLATFFADVRDDELAVLIYTSGTTGTPKGVMLSHRNLVSNASDAFEPAVSGLKSGEVALSVLPFAHIYEHTNALGFLYCAAEHWVTTPERLLVDLRRVRPNHIAFVPRIFERIVANIVGSAVASGGLKAKLVPWALETGTAYQRALADGHAPSPALRAKYLLAQALVLRKIRPALGLDRLNYFVSGSAPLHRDTALLLAGCGLPICEGYGQTETAPVVTVNRFGSQRLGTVGPTIANVQVRIADDGEVQVKGPNVMLGYYHVPASEQPFTPDGWLMTGDIGELDADGYLRITDRKRELFKTSGGKWISPARVETAIKRSVLVGQVVCVGDGRAHPAVLVAPNWALVRAELGIDDGVATAELAARDDVRALMLREVRAHTADLARFEQIEHVALLPRDLTIEDEELSPTLKVKRRVVEARYRSLIEAAYAAGASRPRAAVSA